MKPKPRSLGPKTRRGFNLEQYLDSTGPASTVVQYPRDQVVFAQGEPGDDVRYIQKGTIKLSVLSRVGKEAVVAILTAGDFFGEGALAGQSIPSRQRRPWQQAACSSSRRPPWCGCSTKSPPFRTASAPTC